MVQFFAKHADFGVEFVATGFETLEVRGAGGDGGGEGGDFGEVVFVHSGAAVVATDEGWRCCGGHLELYCLGSGVRC